MEGHDGHLTDVAMVGLFVDVLDFGLDGEVEQVVGCFEDEVVELGCDVVA